jgi:hypothetical protein
MNMADDDKKEQSDFNEANFQILRLHELSMSYSNCWIKNVDYNKAMWILDQFWVELCADAVDEDKNKHEKETFSYQIMKCDEEIHKAKNRYELYKAIQKKRMTLKMLQEACGKGSKKSKKIRKVM